MTSLAVRVNVKPAFTVFLRELASHGEGRYHVQFGRFSRPHVISYFKTFQAKPTESYLQFMDQIGPGKFFGGKLTIFQPGRGIFGSRDLVPFVELWHTGLMPVGKLGLGTVCVCLPRDGSDRAMLLDMSNGATSELGDFESWIENCVARLFEPVHYELTRPRMHDHLKAAEYERSKFVVKLESFDIRACREQAMSRFHKAVFRVQKLMPSFMEQLTVKVVRVGSVLGADNANFVTLDVANLTEKQWSAIECYVFDPFHLPFDSLISAFTPRIESEFVGLYPEIRAFEPIAR
ncbi:MAG: hypothetical protein KDC35_16100 [Acidobacteria bacterium]|nr:hypothetical protein [Acidobacteriota bacterium]